MSKMWGRSGASNPGNCEMQKCGASFKGKVPVIQEGNDNTAKTKEKGGGCLKAVLIVFIALIAIGVIGALISDKPKKVGNKNAGESAEQSEEKEDKKEMFFL